jgi:hypothetical protein
MSSTAVKTTNTINNQLLFRIIKMIDIGYIIVLFFLFAYFTGYYLNLFFEYIFGDDNEKKGKVRVILEVIAQFIGVGILSYIGRNLIQLVPFPFNNVNGFQHNMVRELISGSFLTIFLIMFQFDIQSKIYYLRNENSEDKIFLA